MARRGLGYLVLQPTAMIAEYQSRPFRFGVGVLAVESRRSWVDLARQAESLGYSTLFMPDHLFQQLSPIPALASAAEATTALRVGTHVLDNDFRHPVFLAKEAATLDLLSDGRLELGIGAGWLRSDYDTSGLPFDRAGVRIERLRESVEILKHVFSGEVFSYTGKHYTVTEYQGFPLPVQVPHPPLVMGGGGRRMLQFAADEADIISINPMLKSGRFPDVEPEAVGWAIAGEGLSSEAIRTKVEWVREAAGSRMDAIELSCFARGWVTAKRNDAVKQLALMVGMSEEEILDTPHYLVGSVDQIAEDLIRRREELGISYIILGQKSLDSFGAVIEEMAGG